MYCPKCGQPLVLKHVESGRDELYCVQGDMGLSLDMQRTFEERYRANPMPQSPNPPFSCLTSLASSAWFCRFRFDRLAEEAFFASPSLAQHSHPVPA